jgi:hypothetical protein
MKIEKYEKYRWFVTSSNKIVIGGKSSEQNEEVMEKANPEDTVLHTSSPGSPFCIIENPTKKDIQETAIFCGCFSQDWKRKKKKADIDVFKRKQAYKTKGMKKGTFGVKGKIGKEKVPLKLALTKQKNKLKAVPKSAAKNKIFLEIEPGKLKKDEAIIKVYLVLEKNNIKASQEEIMQALPSDGIKIIEIN